MQSFIALEGYVDDFIEFADCDEYSPIPDVEPTKPLGDRNYDRAIQLRGPNSPLESQVHSVLIQNGNRSVNIDAHSVNSVLLTSLQQVC